MLGDCLGTALALLYASVLNTQHCRGGRPGGDRASHFDLNFRLRASAVGFVTKSSVWQLLCGRFSTSAASRRREEGRRKQEKGKENKKEDKDDQEEQKTKRERNRKRQRNFNRQEQFCTCSTGSHQSLSPSSCSLVCLKEIASHSCCSSFRAMNCRSHHG